MYQRQLCPSVSAMLRPLTHDAAALSGCYTRAFHVSARRREENDRSSSSAPKSTSPIETPRTRSRAAVGKVLNLTSNNNGSLASTSSTTNPPPGRFLIRKQLVGGGARTPSQSSAPPAPGKMVRAPSTLRITRNAPRRGPTGPNLRGRENTGSGGPRSEKGVGQPKRRQKAVSATAGPAMQRSTEPKAENTLSDGMVQLLLRLQRQEWDKKKYEPKYAPGSKAAQELIEAGKKLFEGQKPVVKKWGKLEHVIGVVGMHGAHATE